jgi:hypothetical protein
VPQAAGASSDHFAVDRQGKVYLVAFKEKGLSVVVFDSEGRYDSTIRLDRIVGPRQLAVFPSGEFLLSGYKLDGRLRSTNEPFVGLFDRAGRLIRELELPDDVKYGGNAAETPVEASTAATGEDRESVTQGSPNQPSGSEKGSQEPVNPLKLQRKEFDSAIDLSRSTAADDGNVYLMRAISTPIVYVITSSGAILRRISIASPGPDFAPSAIKVAGGSILVEFYAPPLRGRIGRFLFVIANAETGESLAHYTPGPKIGGALACYTLDNLIFVSATAGGGLGLDIVYPR